MDSNIKILIAGVGGVGGYFGGKLAKFYQNSDTLQVDLYVRGNHLLKIREQGLKVITENEEFTAIPHLATYDVSNLGQYQYIFICTKAYDLDEILIQLKPCIQAQTVIIPLLNGIDHRQKVLAHFPENTVADACVYIVSRLHEPGVILKKGKVQKMFFGIQNKDNDRLEQLQEICQTAGLEATHTSSIQSVIWEKFLYLSALASANCYFDCNIGELLKDETRYQTLIDLLNENLLLANAKGIRLEDDILEKTIKRFHSMPADSTTSMHSDFNRAGARNELETLTAYVVREALKYNMEAPTYKRVYQKLRST